MAFLLIMTDEAMTPLCWLGVIDPDQTLDRNL